MKFKVFYCIIAILLSCVSSQQHNAQNDIIVAGYLPDYRSYIDINSAASHLDDLILFSISPEPTTSASASASSSSSSSLPSSISSLSSCCLDQSHYSKAREARRTKNPKLNIFVSVGGGGRSNHFAKISSKESGRQALIKDLIALW